MILSIVIFFALAIWHYSVQSIYIPNYLHRVKYDLYAKRDELRMLRIEGKIQDQEFKELDQVISNLINFSKHFAITDFWLNDLFNRNKPTLAEEKRTQRKIEIIENCTVEEYQVIKNFAFDTGIQLSIKNSTGWSPYLVLISIALSPLVIISMLLKSNFISNLKSKVSNRSSRFAMQIGG